MTNFSTTKLVNLNQLPSEVNLIEKPLLFLDTCSLLDIIRIPLPEREHLPGLDQRIIAIKDLIIADKINCLSSEICIKELNDNKSEVFLSYEAQLKKIQAPVNRYLEIINNSGVTTHHLEKVDLDSYKLENYFSDIAKSIFDKTIFIREQPSIKDAAHFRVIDKTAPAKKKGEYKDCMVWETFIQTLKLKNSFQERSYFVSSNKQDYCESKSSTDLIPELKTEIQNFNAFFALTFLRLDHYFKEHNIYSK